MSKDRKIRLLIVDDNIAVRSLLRDFFQSRGYQVDVAEDGQEAIDLVFHHGDTYHCILTDIQMPVMDGVSFADAVHRVHPDIPIIALTATPGRATGGMVGPSHFDYVITKPFKLSQVLGTVREICHT